MKQEQVIVIVIIIIWMMWFREKIFGSIRYQYININLYLFWTLFCEKIEDISISISLE